MPNLDLVSLLHNFATNYGKVRSGSVELIRLELQFRNPPTINIGIKIKSIFFILLSYLI